MFRAMLFAVAVAAAAWAQAPLNTTPIDELREQVRRAEIAFAKTMADRDHAAFVRFLAPDAIFFGPGGETLRGAIQVAQTWRPFFESKDAPFSWVPEQVEVLPSGSLALSSGPVRDPGGNRIATFNSVWRREPDGRWRVVFDKACEACPSAPPARTP